MRAPQQFIRLANRSSPCAQTRAAIICKCTGIAIVYLSNEISVASVWPSLPSEIGPGSFIAQIYHHRSTKRGGDEVLSNSLITRHVEATAAALYYLRQEFWADMMRPTSLGARERGRCIPPEYTAHSHASNISLAGVLTLPLHRDAWLTFPPHIHRE
jgi:hypothetical protein